MHYSTIDKLPHVVIIIIPYTLALVCVCVRVFLNTKNETNKQRAKCAQPETGMPARSDSNPFPRSHARISIPWPVLRAHCTKHP